MNTSKTKTRQLSEEQILKQPKSKYMSEEQLEFFRQRLLELYDSTNAHIQQAKNNMVNPLSSSDSNDRATSEEQSNIAMRIVDREQKLLPKIQKSLERIRLGEYGYCLESGEPIGIPRLLARPTAEYCADVKSLKEKKEFQYKD